MSSTRPVGYAPRVMRSRLSKCGPFIRGFLAMVLIAGAIGKIFAPDESLRTVSWLISDFSRATEAQLPSASVHDLARGLLRVLIALEVGVGLAAFLLSGPGAAAAAFALFSMFVAVLIVLITSSAPVGCGCGIPGLPAGEKVGLTDVARTASLAAVALFSVYTEWPSRASSMKGVTG